MGIDHISPAQALEAARDLEKDPKVMEGINARKIERVVHFTTNPGLTGILQVGSILSHRKLGSEQTLEHILQLNNPVRKDPHWLDFVNLSVTRTNIPMLSYSKYQHTQDDVWWCLLALSPELLSSPGVVFTTTNNIYPSCSRRSGAEGLADMFRDPVEGRYQQSISRTPNHQPNQPTDPQAEVLFPNGLSTDYLVEIIVETDDHADMVDGMLGALNRCDHVAVRVDPEEFR